jgi:pimeloyl-ACP methyl ester carboxylesterase
MQTISSADGTTIAYEREGAGPALIIVDGALCARGAKAGLAALLAPDFTVYRYDRRGRGDSGDTPPYAVEREIEDLLALIGAAGGTAFLYGHSSGCALVLDTILQAGQGTQASVRKIALYEAPYNDDPAAQAPWKTYLGDLADALAAGRRGDAVARFMAYLGMPAAQVDEMRQAPFFPTLAAIAPTLAYDHAGLMGESLAVPVAKAAHVAAEALVIYGGASFPFMAATARTLSAEMPHARLREMDGQTHDVDPAVLAPVLGEFFGA